jgi:crossover junction endodeoxyribonuclease RusA
MPVTLPLEVSFPPRILNPNKSKGKHWGTLSGAKKTYLHEVFWSAKEALQKGWIVHPRSDKIKVHLIFIPPCERGPIPDDDNLETAFKSGRDGLAKALGVDDRCFMVSKEVTKRDPACPLGKVQIQLEAA